MVKRPHLTMTRKSRFGFKHISDIVYHVTEYGGTYLVVRAYGLTALVVDKHLTAMQSKSTTNFYRFDRLARQDDEDPDQDWWFATEGPLKKEAVERDLCDVFNKITEHHENYIAKLIVE